jgi:hypothetical protein
LIITIQLGRHAGFIVKIWIWHITEKRFGNMRLKQIGVSLLLILGAAHAFADSGGYRREGRDTVRAFYLQSSSVTRGDQRGEPRVPRQPDGSRGRESGLPDSSGSSQAESGPPPDNKSKQGRLTQEEKRALRRQIDEAGHDIYVPKR